ncbi:hypothetical protein HPB51_027733 [Rhipicephalus microplus]|uniref:Uncharacterized protein n=1 Tax=Rhipicephalus microplus TaxID=6941 RepID=A0A9J6CZC9_RHIMP|nr:hypothetical protein HPB51_027733 [Rhipicephalus microplus]
MNLSPASSRLRSPDDQPVNPVEVTPVHQRESRRLREGSPLMVNQTKRMVSEIQSAFRDALLNSLWISYKEEGGVLKKFDDIVIKVGSPGRRLDPEFIEEYYNNLWKLCGHPTLARLPHHVVDFFTPLA